MSTDLWQSHAASNVQLDKQMRAWEDAKRLRLSKPRDQRSQIEDCICISREVGAGGSHIARLLGEKLSWAVFDQELLHMMAGDDDARERVYSCMDEHDTSWLESMLQSFTVPEMGLDDYLHKLTRAVYAIARQGHAVFLGRGANRMLPRESILSVRLIAPLELRVGRYAERRGIDRSAAHREIEHIESERAHFFKRHFHLRVEDPDNYDLVINTGRFDPETVAELIAQAWRMRADSGTEKNNGHPRR